MPSVYTEMWGKVTFKECTRR